MTSGEAPKPSLTVVTIGVADVARSGRFYERLGFERRVRATGDEIVFLQAGGIVLALWDRDKLAADAALSASDAAQGFGGITLAWNCTSPEAVDEAFDRAMAAGANRLRDPGPTDYGGYRGYFADPDGHVWEVVQAPGFTLRDDGRLILPE